MKNPTETPPTEKRINLTTVGGIREALELTATLEDMGARETAALGLQRCLVAALLCLVGSVDDVSDHLGDLFKALKALRFWQ
jgi:hypothetical protein